jgi:uncharacterized membrane protein YfcA
MIDASYALAAAFTGFVVGLTGVSGGVLMTPILLIFSARALSQPLRPTCGLRLSLGWWAQGCITPTVASTGRLQSALGWVASFYLGRGCLG